MSFSLTSLSGETSTQVDFFIAVSRTELLFTHSDPPRRITLLYVLSSAWVWRLKNMHKIEDFDLDEAINAAREVCGLMPIETPDYGDALDNLGYLLRVRSNRTNSNVDLDLAIIAMQRALELTPTSNPEILARLHNVGNALRNRFERGGVIGDLELAIMTLDQACQAKPTMDKFERSTTLSNLGAAVELRYQRTGSLDDLKRAIAIQEEALTFLSADDPERAPVLNNLGNAFRSQFEATGKLLCLTKAVNALEDAVNATSIPEASRYKNLADALQSRYETTRSIEDLDRAIQAAKRAVEVSTLDDQLYATYIGTLGSTLLCRFRETGSMDDLQDSIDAKEQSVKLEKNLQLYPMHLVNLGIALINRFEETKSTHDLERAIFLCQDALKSTPGDDPVYAVRLHTLGSVFIILFRRSGMLVPIDRAVTAFERSLTLTPKEHPARAQRLGSLGSALHCRFLKKASEEDLQRAIDVIEECLDLSQTKDPNLATHLSYMADALKSRYELTGTVMDLWQAISNIHCAINVLPSGNPRLAGLHMDLARTLELKYVLTASKVDLNDTINAFEQVLRTNGASPSFRIYAAEDAVRLLYNENPVRARDLLRLAVELLPTVSPGALRRGDQEQHLARFGGISSKVTSLYLACDQDPLGAVELLELGRGVLAALQVGVRFELSTLRSSHPELAEQFERLRDQLDRPTGSLELMQHPGDVDIHRHDRLELSEEFNSLVAKIRGLDGFERFLRGPSKAEIMNLAADGPIVVINVSEIRSDAIMVEKNGIRSINLPLLRHRDLTKYADQFNSAVQSVNFMRQQNGKAQLREVLEWLWDVAAQPVLNELGYISTPMEKDYLQWPRVWWICNGLLSIMPIHAAGYHERCPPESVIDRVISSYIPTLKSLAYAREAYLRTADTGTQKALFIAMPKTPAQYNLPVAEEEAYRLQHLLPPPLGAVVMVNPTKQIIESFVLEYHIAHFACHGFSSSVEASQSALLLADWETLPFTISDIIKLKPRNPQLAFLSACHSARLEQFNLLDEYVNLSSGMLLAGYPSVIGTLWSIVDRKSPDVSLEVYQGMLEGDCVNTRRAAVALHSVTRQLRNTTRIVPGFKRKTDSDPRLWAGYLYLGI